MDFKKIINALKEWAGMGLGAPLLIVMLLALLILPLPPFVLDLFFTFNIAFSLIILLVVIYTTKPLEFAAFPTVILGGDIVAFGAKCGFDAGGFVKRP